MYISAFRGSVEARSTSLPNTTLTLCTVTAKRMLFWMLEKLLRDSLFRWHMIMRSSGCTVTNVGFRTHIAASPAPDPAPAPEPGPSPAGIRLCGGPGPGEARGGGLALAPQLGVSLATERKHACISSRHAMRVDTSSGTKGGAEVNAFSMAAASSSAAIA